MFQYIVHIVLFIDVISGAGFPSSSSSAGNGTVLCYDKDPDCSQDICQNYPYTAKERCPKFCALCRDSSSESQKSHSSTRFSSSHQQTFPSSHQQTMSSKSRITESRILNQGQPSSSNAGSGTVLCYDKDPNCSQDICQNYPYTAKERCPKFCGLCRDSSSGRSQKGHSSTKFSSSHQQTLSTKSGITESTILNKDKELECIDLNDDCTQHVCKEYPFTAKMRCAKTCGYCRKQLTDRSDTTNINDRYLSHTDDKQRSRPSSQSNQSGGSLWQGNKPSGSTGRTECRDQHSGCSHQSCLDQPHSARIKCAKTCGFCGDIIDLQSSTEDNLDRGSIITLDSDDNGSHSSIQSTVTTRRRPTSGTAHGMSTQHSRHSSISSRTEPVHKPSSSLSFVQKPTSKPSEDGLKRYPGRTGPCVDDNNYCEKADCHKYPRFGQRYCEKTCNYC